MKFAVFQANLIYRYNFQFHSTKKMQKNHRSSNRSSDTIASFLLKTFEILENAENRKTINWDRDGIGFVVIDVVNFTREILPKYFRHSNFSSFVRQLNMYDFHKVKQQNEMLVFKNPLFVKGEQHKLKFIKRKTTKKCGHHRRYYQGEKTFGEAEKYNNAFKWLKKTTETELNQSCSHFEKSLQLLKETNELNKIKKGQLTQISSSVDKGEQVDLDLLYNLREGCYGQLEKIERWLEESIEMMRRKLRAIGNFNSQVSQITRKDEEPEGDKERQKDSKEVERERKGLLSECSIIVSTKKLD